MNTLQSFSLIINNSDIFTYFFHFLVVLFLNIISYSYIAIKFYKLVCYSKLTFDWLPMINPYVWPFSVFQVLTGPYFKFWSRIFPPLKFEKSSIEISSIIALEALNSILYFLVKFSNILILILLETESSIDPS